MHAVWYVVFIPVEELNFINFMNCDTGAVSYITPDEGKLTQ